MRRRVGLGWGAHQQCVEGPGSAQALQLDYFVLQLQPAFYFSGLVLDFRVTSILFPAANRVIEVTKQIAMFVLLGRCRCSGLYPALL